MGSMTKLGSMLIVLVLTGCGESRTLSAERETKAAHSEDCLAAMNDAELTAAQAKAQSAAPRERTAAWVSVGHNFVRVARTRSTPLFYRNVEACAARALGAAPDDPGALQLRGLVMMDEHRFSDARALAETLIERDREDVAAWGLLSDASLELGATDEATRAAQRMLDLKPSLLSYGRAAHLRFLAGDKAGALEMYSLAISSGRHLKDREPSAWMIVQAALVFLDKGDLPGAEAGFDAALRELPNYQPALDGKQRLAEARAKASL
jgi:tetratricopeptide (TPR) repeat protein